MKTKHEALMEDPEFHRLLSVETLAAEASEMIARLMTEQNVTKADLARRLSKSRPWVTQLLSGKANLTIRTLAEVVHALNSEVKLHAQPPKLKGHGKPTTSAGQLSVVFKMDKMTLQSSVSSQDLFRLQSNKTTTTNEELASVSVDDDPSLVEYAA